MDMQKNALNKVKSCWSALFCVWNKTKITAKHLDWLLIRRDDENDRRCIFWQLLCTGTPDFCCASGSRFSHKTTNKVVFSSRERPVFFFQHSRLPEVLSDAEIGQFCWRKLLLSVPWLCRLGSHKLDFTWGPKNKPPWGGGRGAWG